MFWERIRSTAAIICALVLVAAAATNARIIYVDDNAPPGGDGVSWATAYRYLQDALAEVGSVAKPVEVHVAGGLYRPDEHEWAPDGTGDQRVWFRFGDGVSLIGGYAGLRTSDPNVWDPQAYETILSGDLAGDDAEVTDPTLLRKDPTRNENTDWAVVEVANGQTVLRGCTITGGTAGGVFLNQYPRDLANNVTIRDCRFYGNRGSDSDFLTGGALTAWYAVLADPHVVVQRCSFVCNTGGAAGALGCSGIIEQCQFLRNHAWGSGEGGAARIIGSSMVTDCVFIENSSDRHGGALQVGSYSSVSQVARCIFRDNSAGRGGGGILCEGDVDLYDCLFLGNSAGTNGGAVVHSGGSIEIANCVFVGSQAAERGGACSFGWASLLAMRNCTAVENHSEQGAFLACSYFDADPSSGADVSNCVMSGGADEIWSNGVPVKVAYSCFGQSLGFSEATAELISLGAGIIEADPCFADPGYWDANDTPGDPTDDFYVAGDYHLKSQAGRWDPASESWVQDDVTSPCIDAGDPNSPIMYEPFPNGGIINMGAYGGTAEASKSYFGQPDCETIIAGDINGDCKVDMKDLVLLISHWTDE